jgi:hypothetical protein
MPRHLGWLFVFGGVRHSFTFDSTLQAAHSTDFVPHKTAQAASGASDAATASGA